jgi:hypothetical protein
MSETKIKDALRLAKEYVEDEDWSRALGCINLAIESLASCKPAEPLTESQILWGYYAATPNSLMAHDHFKAGALFAQKHFGIKEKA